jgi:hypothetical protein
MLFNLDCEGFAGLWLSRNKMVFAKKFSSHILVQFCYICLSVSELVACFPIKLKQSCSRISIQEQSFLAYHSLRFSLNTGLLHDTSVDWGFGTNSSDFLFQFLLQLKGEKGSPWEDVTWNRM